MGQFSVEICPPVGQFTVKLNMMNKKRRKYGESLM